MVGWVPNRGWAQGGPSHEASVPRIWGSWTHPLQRPGDPPPLTSDSIWEMRQVYCTGDLTFSENPVNSFSTNIFRGSLMLKPAEDPRAPLWRGLEGRGSTGGQRKGAVLMTLKAPRRCSWGPWHLPPELP